MRNRTRDFALRVLKLVRFLPNRMEGWVVGKQLLRSATSVAANYRATNLARSRAEFFAKLCIVVEESDETLFWLELICDAGLLSKDHADELDATITEASQLIRIFSSARKSVKTNTSQNNQMTK